jgi:hypothetical protein
MAWGLKKRVSSAHSHRWNKTRRKHWILICASPQEFVKVAKVGATDYFLAISNIKILSLSRLHEKLRFPRTAVLMNYWVILRILAKDIFLGGGWWPCQH